MIFMAFPVGLTIASISCRQAYRSIGGLESLTRAGQNYRWRGPPKNLPAHPIG
jgi:hypothetical protein